MTINAYFKMPFGLCFCGKKETETYRVLDYSHGNLADVPTDIYEYAPTLEELYLDANLIRDLPKALFNLHHLKLLNIGDNEIVTLPSNICNLIHLVEFDISKNGFLGLPDTIKGMKSLEHFDLSVNPLGRLPDEFTMLLNLTHVYLNDTFLDFLPANIGRMVKLEILEIRDNHLTMIPKSMNRLQNLRRLDIGNNEFNQLPEVIGSFEKLEELWVDCNKIQHIPPDIGNLKCLRYLDMTENSLQWIADEIGDCVMLTDLHLTTNNLGQLPESLCKLKMLETLKVDDNRLTYLPTSIGGLTNLQELVCSGNELETLPPGIGLLRKLETLNADENYIEFLPDEVGSCIHMTVLSVRQNRMSRLPDDIGRLSNLTVVNVSSNMLERLPYSMMKLKKLKALWLSENQAKPLIPLQTDWDSNNEKRYLTCYMFPQRPLDECLYEKKEGEYEERESFHASLFEEEWKKRTSVIFDVDDEDPEVVRLTRQPTPFPKDIRDKINQFRNHAIAKGQLPGNDNAMIDCEDGQSLVPPPKPPLVRDDLSTTTSSDYSDYLTQNTTKVSTAHRHQPIADENHLNRHGDMNGTGNGPIGTSEQTHSANFSVPAVPSPLSSRHYSNEEDSASVEGLYLNVQSKKNIKLSSDSGLGSVELVEEPNSWKNEYPAIPEQDDRFRVTITKTPHLGFSVCGGIDAPENKFKPADKGIFVTKVLAEGPASSHLKIGDKILEVNGNDFTAIEHEHAVTILKSHQQVDLLVLRSQTDQT